MNPFQKLGHGEVKGETIVHCDPEALKARGGKFRVGDALLARKDAVRRFGRSLLWLVSLDSHPSPWARLGMPILKAQVKARIFERNHWRSIRKAEKRAWKAKRLADYGKYGSL